ncbi:NAD-dependent succinate-semialdehyde dehydrogenase [Arthrobacter sp. GCM10027362]|uniref:NAD-dependent succinate-semialdehyde dehydrogenase n=1 Tax=Arthrobacter sp. GCM10027362 TaxID=3273379 RepID=UPI003636BE1A
MNSLQTTTQAERILDAVPDELFIGGWTPSQDHRTLTVYNPATDLPIKTIADGSPDDGLKALGAAAQAAQHWARTSPLDRSNLLRKVYEAVIDKSEEMATLITLEMGKTLSEARTEVVYGADYIRWYSEEAVRFEGRNRLSPDGLSRIVTSKEPVGPSLLITPWNFPLAMATRKIAPALAAGCTVILKPAELTPLTSLFLARLLGEAGVPEGVVNVVTTSNAPGLSEAMMKDNRLRKVSFTGSTVVGKRLVAQASDQMLRMSMELGGNAPLIVFEDADLDNAVKGAVTAKLRNGGQSCVASNRILVHESVADAFVDKFARQMAGVTLGNGLDPATALGPLIDGRAVDKCALFVEDAIGKGARAVVGGKRVPGAGHFYPATVLDHVPLEARIMHEEVFGPVAPVYRFATDEEAVSVANDTPFGLASFIFSRDLNRVQGIVDQLQSGMVGVNRGTVSNVAAPFGGIKHSGLGREGGSEGIEEYLNVKYVAYDRA